MKQLKKKGNNLNQGVQAYATCWCSLPFCWCAETPSAYTYNTSSSADIRAKQKKYSNYRKKK